MNPIIFWLAVYCAAILLFALLGGSVPFLGRVTHGRLQLYLSLSAGVMLGASFFHVMPDAMEFAGEKVFGWSIALGVVGLLCVERFIAPHSHEVSSKLQQEHKHEPGCEHDHEHHAAPAVAGWTAVFGLTIHTFINGVGLAGAVKADIDKPSAGLAALPGLALFLAIVLHKPADALAITTVLSRKGVSRGKIGLVLLGFAATVPIGAFAFLAAEKSLGPALRTQLTGAALAFSAGAFLFVALSDLLPEIQFHRHDRVPLASALILGVVFMGLIAYLEPHEEKAGPTETTQQNDGGHPPDKN